MELRRLCSVKDPLFDLAFALYERSFPLHEQRRLDKQTALLGNHLYHFEVIADGGALVGILLWWEGAGYAYIEHLAIHPAMRGRAIGGGVLDEFCKTRPLVILEIDPPVDAVTIGRERFYLRHGFKSNGYPHLHPPYRRQFPPHELVVMSFPEQLDEEQYILFQWELREIVMRDTFPSTKYPRLEL